MSLAVNFEKWGYISEWTTAPSTTGSYFTYPWNRSDWSALYANNHQSIDDDIDLSIAPWRINKKSSLVNLIAPYYYNNWKEEDSEQIATATERYQAHLSKWNPIVDKNVPFILSYWGGTGTTQNTYWTKYWAYKVNGEEKGNNIVGSRYPVTNFRYDKIRICPVVWLIDTDPKDMSVNMPTRSQWGGFPTLSDIENKPYCVGVGFEIFIDKNGTWTESPLTLDINTEFNGCHDYDLEDSWFSGYDGFHMMRMPYRYNPAGTHYNNMFFGNSASNSPDSSLWCHGSSKAFDNAFSRGNDSSTSLPSYFPMNGIFWEVDFNERTATTSAGTFTSVAYCQLSASNYEEFKAAVMRELAFIGLPFTLSRSSISTATAADGTIYYPVFDSQRCTTGEYVTGAEAEALDNYTWQWIYELPELPPDIEPHEDPVDYGDTNNRGTGRHFLPVGYNVYLTDSSNYNRLVTELTGYYLSKTPDDWTLDFQGVNPSDYIVGAYVSQIAFPHGSVGDNIKIGAVTLQTASAYTLDTSQSYWEYFSYGTRDVTPYYEDFRDYAPYTEIELYLPLAGTVKLDTNYCMNHSITVEYYYDILTMSGVAAVYRDNMLYLCQDFQAGSQIPFLSSNMGSYQNQIAELDTARKQNNMRLITSSVSAIAGATSIATGAITPAGIAATIGGVAGVLETVNKNDKIDYQIDHTAPAISQTGAAESQNALSIGQLKPKLIIKRPIMLQTLDDSIYSKTVGNACCINTTIGANSGLIVCSNVDTTGIPATVDEINAIKQALANGVIV